MRPLLMLLAMMLVISTAALAAGDMPTGMGAGPAMTSDTESDVYSRTFVVQYYALPESDVIALRSQGFSWDQIHIMANAAVRTNQPISRMAELRSQGMTWSQIADRYNVPVSDLTSPTRPRMMATMPPMYGAGPATVAFIYDHEGNVLLTAQDAERYCNMGYDWVDIAVATNLSRESGYPVSWLLSEMRTGTLNWQSTTVRFGVPPSVAYNVTGYPFTLCGASAADRKMRGMERYQKPGGILTTPRAMSPMPTTPMMTPTY